MACVFAGQPAAGDLILCDDPAALRQQQEAVEQAVSAGATAVILELPVGVHTVAGDAVTVVPGGMGQRHFVDCGTGHPLVQDFRPYDCWFWHDASVGYPTPLLTTVLDPRPPAGRRSWTAATVRGRLTGNRRPRRPRSRTVKAFSASARFSSRTARQPTRRPPFWLAGCWGSSRHQDKTTWI